MSANLSKSPLHADLRKSIGGQYVKLPNLYQLAPDWKPRMHQDYLKAREEFLNPWLRRWVNDERKCKKMEDANFGMFAAVLCSESSLERLCTMAKHFAWYFIWDDIFDCGTLQYDFDGMQAYRDASMRFFRYSLLEEENCPDLSNFSLELQNALNCWTEIAEHIRRECSVETRQILLDWMLAYVSSVSNVDSLFSGDVLPSLDAYWNRRELTAAVYSVMAMIPFCYEIDITKSDVEDENMVLLWKHTSYLVHITNDMFSLRKEFNDNQLENLIPILSAHTGLNCNQAMQLSYHICRKEVDGFHANANMLLQRANGSSHIPTLFIRGCQDVFMGLIHWSYSGERYFRICEFDEDYCVEFRVGSTAKDTAPSLARRLWRGMGDFVRKSCYFPIALPMVSFILVRKFSR